MHQTILHSWSLCFKLFPTLDNKMVKPYNISSHGHVKKWLTVVASLMLVACLVVKIILNTEFFTFPAHYDLASRSRL